MYKFLKQNELSVENTVIKNDLCSGCGACSYLQPSKFQMKLDQYEMIKACVIDDAAPQDDAIDRVCPFSNDSKNEDVLARELYPDAEFSDDYLGKYRSTYVGYVKEGDFRDKGGSGGIGKWLLQELMKRNLVDYVIQVSPEVVDGDLFSYRVYKQGEDLTSGAKSAYYPITLKGVLEFMKENDGRYAVTAVPCFAKALRNLADNDKIIDERLHFVVGIVCGHLKSAYFAKLLGWQVGVKPENLKGIDFRGEVNGGVANDKALTAKSLDGVKSMPTATRSLFGGNWGYNFFKYKACDFCDDVVAETADISVGDAWLPEYNADPKGNNIVVCRNKIVDRIIKEAMAENKLSLDAVSPETIFLTQLGGFKHKREGLNHRVRKAKSSKEWVPNKRYLTRERIHRKRKNIYDMRVALRVKADPLFKEAMGKNDLSYFKENLRPLIHQLENTPPEHILIASARKVYRKIKKIMKGLR